MKTSCSSTYMRHTDPAPIYCYDCSSWYTANSFTFQVSDPTNNLYDCETSGIILDGTIYINFSGTLPVINISITGTLGINRRGDAGGLVPITDDCSIFMYYNGTSQAWTGTICGYTVSSLEVNSAPMVKF